MSEEKDKSRSEGAPKPIGDTEIIHVRDWLKSVADSKELEEWLLLVNSQPMVVELYAQKDCGNCSGGGE